MGFFRTSDGSKVLAALLIFGAVLASRFLYTGTSPETVSSTSDSNKVATLERAVGTPAKIPTQEPVQKPQEEKVHEVIKPPASLPVNPPPALAKQNTKLSEADIFKLQHPQYYIDYLKELQGFMVGDHFIDASEEQPFNNEDDVLSFWRDKGFSYLVDKNVLQASDRSKFNAGLSLVKSIHLAESASLRAEAPADKEQTFLERTMREIAAFLAPGEAQAQSCFTPGPPTPTPGINLTAPCCACHGPFGVPIGCLNLICAGRPALFDQTTFICGCGL